MPKRVKPKDMFKEKHITSDFVTFEQHKLDGWSTDKGQPIKICMQKNPEILNLVYFQ